MGRTGQKYTPWPLNTTASCSLAGPFPRPITAQPKSHQLPPNTPRTRPPHHCSRGRSSRCLPQSREPPLGEPWHRWPSIWSRRWLQRVTGPLRDLQPTSQLHESRLAHQASDQVTALPKPGPQSSPQTSAHSELMFPNCPNIHKAFLNAPLPGACLGSAGKLAQGTPVLSQITPAQAC